MHASLGNYSSDIFRLLSVVGAYGYAGGGHQFCNEHFVRPKVRLSWLTLSSVHITSRRLWMKYKSCELKLATSFMPNFKILIQVSIRIWAHQVFSRYRVHLDLKFTRCPDSRNVSSKFCGNFLPQALSIKLLYAKIVSISHPPLVPNTRHQEGCLTRHWE
jgi:hypothetical protein